MKMTPTFIHYHPSHTKVKPFAGQRQYLHFSATLRPWVLVWSQGLNQGPPALQWSAVSTKLALHYCQTLTEKPKHLKYFRKVCVMNNNSRDQKRQTSHQAQTNFDTLCQARNSKLFEWQRVYRNNKDNELYLFIFIFILYKIFILNTANILSHLDHPDWIKFSHLSDTFWLE